MICVHADRRGQVHYLMQNDTLRQELHILYLKSDLIAYKLWTTNRLTELTHTARGRAKAYHFNEDPEVDNDSVGTAYPAVEYCDTTRNLCIRIHALTQDWVQITAPELPPAHRLARSPLSSQGILYRCP